MKQLPNADLGSLEMDYKCHKNKPFGIELTRLGDLSLHIVNEITCNVHFVLWARAPQGTRDSRDTAGVTRAVNHALFSI